jgi:hypothetical protein
MIEVGIVIAGGVAISTILSVLFYNMRRSRCVKCKTCCCEIERENMSAESLKNDKLELPNVL